MNQSHCGASIDNTRVTDLAFTDDAVSLAEALDVPVVALEALHEEVQTSIFHAS